MAELDQQVRYWDEAAETKTFTHPVYWPWIGGGGDGNGDGDGDGDGDADTDVDGIGDGLDRRAAVVLDYGCGYGRTVGEFVRRGFGDVRGVDISSVMVERARREQPAGRFAVLDGSGVLAEPDASIDLVLLFAVLTCIPGDDAQRALIDEVARVLKPGGLLYVSDLLLQDDDRNRARYERDLPRYGTFGVFETGDGAVCRHHSAEHLHALLDARGGLEGSSGVPNRRLEVVREREISVATMNGNTSRGLQLLATAAPTATPAGPATPAPSPNPAD